MPAITAEDSAQLTTQELLLRSEVRLGRSLLGKRGVQPAEAAETLGAEEMTRIAKEFLGESRRYAAMVEEAQSDLELLLTMEWEEVQQTRRVGKLLALGDVDLDFVGGVDRTDMYRPMSDAEIENQLRRSIKHANERLEKLELRRDCVMEKARQCGELAVQLTLDDARLPEEVLE